MGQAKDLLLPYSPETHSAGGIGKGHEILGTEPTEPGWGIPPTQGLMLGKGQPECHQLPLSIVQGPGISVALPHDAFSHGDPASSSDFFPLMGVVSYPVYLCQDPLTRVVHQIWSLLWP